MCGGIRYEKVERLVSIERCPPNRGVLAKWCTPWDAEGAGCVGGSVLVPLERWSCSKGYACVVEHAIKGIGPGLCTAVTSWL